MCQTEESHQSFMTKGLRKEDRILLKLTLDSGNNRGPNEGSQCRVSILRNGNVACFCHLSS